LIKEFCPGVEFKTIKSLKSVANRRGRKKEKSGVATISIRE